MHVHLNYKDYLPLFIANGVTGVRVMWGDPEHSQWRKQIDDGQLLGPRMMIGSAIIDGPNPYWHGSISVANETQARQAVDEAKRDGADFVKIYQFLPRDLYLDIADEAKKQAIPFAGHVPISVTAEEASFAGQKKLRASGWSAARLLNSEHGSGKGCASGLRRRFAVEAEILGHPYCRAAR
jgi:hypothetical protein